MKKQMEDTHAKFIICYELNRKTVFECLNQLNRINEVKVIVLEKSLPNENEDLPITEHPNFRFDIQNYLSMFKIIYQYSKLFIDIQNYLSMFKMIYRYSK